LNLKSLSWSIFICFLFASFILCCLIAVVCIHADSLIDRWLLSSARK
jgi:hypothetical protein